MRVVAKDSWIQRGGISMNQVFLMFFFLSVILLLIGFVKPNAVLPGKSLKARSHVWLVYGSVATLLFVLFGMTLPVIQATTDQGAAVEVISSKGVNQPTVVLKNDKMNAMVSDPSYYVNYQVDVISKISTDVEVISNITKFQIWADPVQKKGNIIVVYNGVINVALGDTIQIKGTVGKKLSGKVANGGWVEAVSIIAQSVEKVNQ